MKKGTPELRLPLDWAAARRKLAVLERTPAELAEARATVLRERAVRLAFATDPHEAEQSFLEVLSFERNGRRYAIEARFVVEVGKCGKLSWVPGAGRVLLGVTNLRGDVLPVFDLARVAEGSFGQPLSPTLVVLGADTPDFGVLADSVEQVRRLVSSQLSAVSTLGSVPHPEYVRGVTADACVLLDGEALLRDRSVFVARPISGSASERD